MVSQEDSLWRELKFKRYCRRPFPTYRFTPGVHPHPTANPEGHSYHPPGMKQTPLPILPPEKWQDNEEYLYGCDLYNNGYWWEAHEAWEAIWRLGKRGDLDRSLLHGLIQTSACHLQLYLGRMGGVHRLRLTSTEHLYQVIRSWPDQAFMGLRVSQFLGEVEAYYAVLLAADVQPPVHNPATYPYIRLIES